MSTILKELLVVVLEFVFGKLTAYSNQQSAAAAQSKAEAAKGYAESVVESTNLERDLEHKMDAIAYPKTSPDDAFGSKDWVSSWGCKHDGA